MGFSWKDTISNWISFLDSIGEIVIAVNTSTDGTAGLIRDHAKASVPAYSRVVVKVVEVDVPYSDPEFDGKLKAIALKHCTQPYAILLDMDEVVLPTQRILWQDMARELEYNRKNDALLVPVVDLIGDERSYKSIGSKWYIHRNIPNITRGVHRHARRDDGSIDKTKSDTCELIYADSLDLVRAGQVIMESLPAFLKIGYLESGAVPFVYHLGWLNFEQRLRQAAFWRPVWDNRDKISSEPELKLTDLEKIPKYKHNLPTWKND